MFKARVRRNFIFTLSLMLGLGPAGSFAQDSDGEKIRFLQNNLCATPKPEPKEQIAENNANTQGTVCVTCDLMRDSVVNLRKVVKALGEEARIKREIEFLRFYGGRTSGSEVKDWKTQIEYSKQLKASIEQELAKLGSAHETYVKHEAVIGKLSGGQELTDDERRSLARMLNEAKAPYAPPYNSAYGVPKNGYYQGYPGNGYGGPGSYHSPGTNTGGGNPPPPAGHNPPYSYTYSYGTNPYQNKSKGEDLPPDLHTKGGANSEVLPPPQVSIVKDLPSDKENKFYTVKEPVYSTTPPPNPPPSSTESWPPTEGASDSELEIKKLGESIDQSMTKVKKFLNSDTSKLSKKMNKDQDYPTSIYNEMPPHASRLNQVKVWLESGNKQPPDDMSLEEIAQILKDTNQSKYHRFKFLEVKAKTLTGDIQNAEKQFEEAKKKEAETAKLAKTQTYTRADLTELENQFKGRITNHSPGWKDCGLTVAETLAISDYTRDGYQVLNGALRAGGQAAKDMDPYTETLKAALKKFSPYKGAVRRGTDLPQEALDKHQEGTIVPYPAFTSASVGRGFERAHRFIIVSKTGAYIAPYSTSYSEQEVIIPPGNFKVLSRQPGPNGTIEFVMQQVDD